jgi:aryl-alcohol dehydrogenase-like predicted oxidoreductase
LKYRILGRTGISVSELGLGTVELGQDWGIAVPGEYGCPEEENALALLQRAYDLGINFFDTARVYKKSEERIGKFLKALSRDRGRVTIATKVFMNKKDGLIAMRKGMAECLERSLKALDVDCVDLVQLHSASVEDIEDSTAWEVLDKAREAGKLRFIGSTHNNAESAGAAVACGAFDTIQPTYNPLMPQAGAVIDQAAENKVGVIIKTALLKGAFSYKRKHLDSDMIATSNLVGEFEFLKRSDQTLPQACIRYALARVGTSTVIAGTQRIAHLEENSEAPDGQLFPEEIGRIEELQVFLDISAAEIP